MICIGLRSACGAHLGVACSSVIQNQLSALHAYATTSTDGLSTFMPSNSSSNTAVMPPASASSSSSPTHQRTIKQPGKSGAGFVGTAAENDRHSSWKGLKVPIPASRSSRLTPAEAAAIQNIVGCLTKDGKKAVAQRILLDAMEIMRAELEKGASEAAAAAAADAATKAASAKTASATLKAARNASKAAKAASKGGEGSSAGTATAA